MRCDGSIDIHRKSDRLPIFTFPVATAGAADGHFTANAAFAPEAFRHFSAAKLPSCQVAGTDQWPTKR
jgi:hypothetical protein